MASSSSSSSSSSSFSSSGSSATSPQCKENVGLSIPSHVAGTSTAISPEVVVGQPHMEIIDSDSPDNPAVIGVASFEIQPALDIKPVEVERERIMNARTLNWIRAMRGVLPPHVLAEFEGTKGSLSATPSAENHVRGPIASESR
ncbi:hypothetical protein Salat_1188500 [Sesamum alatum]|uniref:Uncharacterized protein n=1 Tax=Sesamum alatum TaxID=300844 RepID=A0AAE2CNP9_9LAMI|nr:hypothetical protein Salat_1188500 [Sesamum alatum]